ncbi:MAG TPA: GDYXXLXY domain-containing protein [Candidatus Ozemobacteraceae bacterium]|nr:GDYXXLXY domain-containing protein [Candidatus Ozemobacteraceae bacterium]
MTFGKLEKAFAAAVALQVLILVMVPMQQIRSLVIGRTIELAVEPVDPYSIMKGYFVTLSYSVCRPERFSSRGVDLRDGQTVYAVVEEGDDGLWVPVSLMTSPPRHLERGRIFLKGRRTGWRGISYGIEEYSIPEARRGDVDRALRQHMDKARVRVKVDDEGNAALESLIINGVEY